MTPRLVSLVIPVYNEQDNLPELVRRCLAMGRQLPCAFEIVLVNDGSRDDSAKIIEATAAREPEIVGVLLNRNYGQHAAVLACGDRSAYVPALANSFAGNVREIEVEHAERQAGQSKYSVLKLLNLYFDLLVSATTAPLRLMSMVGVALALAGLAFGVLLLVLRFYYGPDWAAQGVFTIFAVLFIFLGVQLIGMGLLGEYIGRISRDVQARPRYIVGARVGSQADADANALIVESSRAPVRSGARSASA